METAVTVHGLGKRYRIGGPKVVYRTAREAVRDAVVAPVRRLRAVAGGGHASSQTSEFWALRDVSFDLQVGEILGIVGANGAGKSTLLKILSRVTDPTAGWAELRGSSGSLLEVGTGFHPELTGRENIYLNGSILGMGRREIDGRLDEIVEFSEISRFLDTPVKRYSSGMRVRLAFSVAAHLEPEILIIDEVLAVGDLSFQRKCLGKMDDVASTGRTVIFVSHDLGAIRRLCTTAMWLDEGNVVSSGPVVDVVDEYVKGQQRYDPAAERTFPDDPGKPVQIRQVRLVDETGNSTTMFDCDGPVRMEFKYDVREQIPQLYGYLSLEKTDGTLVLMSDSHDVGTNPLDSLVPGRHRVRVTIPRRTLGPGEYRVTTTLASRANIGPHTIDAAKAAVSFTLVDHTTRRGNQRGGFLSTLPEWSIAADEEAESG